jgi:hypothetical protein
MLKAPLAYLSALLFLVCGISAFAEAPDPGAPIRNLSAWSESLGLSPYFQGNLRSKRKLKVAVFDNGFKFASDEVGRSLPSQTTIHTPPVALVGEEESHGFFMAKLFYGLLTRGNRDFRYDIEELHLYNTFGYTNLKAAVSDSVERGIDVILYAQTWDFGGNFDGKGFINSLINEATDAGILWINNAGNNGLLTFNGAVKRGPDDWAQLPGKNSSVELRCEKNPTGKCQIRATLAWNSFSDDVEEGTDKDLDLVLADDTLNVIQSAGLRQTVEPDTRPGFSQYSREILSAEVDPGLYLIRVKMRSSNFNSRDRLRITVNGDFLTMNNADLRESLPVAADNPRVLTVGASDSDLSARSERLGKPELLAPSRVDLGNGQVYLGTSNSAAAVAAALVIAKQLRPELSRSEFLRAVRPSRSALGNGLSIDLLGFAPTQGGCFLPLRSEAPPWPTIEEAIDLGGILVQTTAGLKVLFERDPLLLFSGLQRFVTNDMVVLSPNGPGIYNRSGLRQIPEGWIELVQTPRGYSVCGAASGFRMPDPALFGR